MDRYAEDHPESTSGSSAGETYEDEYTGTAASGGDTVAAGDLMAITTDLLSTQLRVRPILTLLAALAAGWLVGKILR